MKNTKKKYTFIFREEKKVTCMSCGQVVFTTLVPFGNGRVASCPHCKQLAYNGA